MRPRGSRGAHFYLLVTSGGYGAFERLFCRPREQTIGKTTVELDMYIHPHERDEIVRGLGGKDTLLQREVWMLRADGGRVLVQVSAQTFMLRDELFVIVACEDVTDKRRIEREILEPTAFEFRSHS